MPKREVLYEENNGSFTLQSGWHIEEDMYENFYVSTSPAPTYGSSKITLEYKLPAGSEIKSAKVYSEWSYPTNGYGFRVKQINGVNLDDNGMVDINIEDPKATSIELEFLFLAIPNVVESTGWKYAYTTVSNIELTIEYTCGVYLYRVEGDKLVPYQLFHAENNALVPYQLFKCVSAEEELSRIAQLMQDEYPQSNVDLLNRPQIDATVMNAAGWDVPEGSYSTVDTVTYTYNDFGLSGDYAINVTPILDDGTVIDGGVDGLWQYISDKLNNGNQFEDLDIFLGKYNTVEEAEAAAQRLHELQEDYYTLKEETAENILIQY